MKNEHEKQMSESFKLGALLAIVGGFLDVYTYICRGQVFSNAQTGNIVLVGLSLAQSDFEGAFYHFVPVLAFIAGVILTEIIKKRAKPRHSFFHWRQIIIGAEIIVVFIMSFVPVGVYDVVVNVSISFVCAMQVEAFRKINGLNMATTMCTGNLRTGTEHIYKSVVEKDISKMKTSIQAYGIIIFFIIGACVGGIFTNIYLEKATLVASAILLIVFIAMFKKCDKDILNELEEYDEIEDHKMEFE